MALSWLAGSSMMSVPLKTMLPEVGRTSLRVALPTVVLPQPLSPTSPRVSPLMTEKLTPSTACTWPTTLPNTPFFTGKSFWRSVTLMSGPA